ncbi:hypothetical protein H490_0103965 [Leucobacter sp. UCD-THU]|uniref:DUF4352 domain-containing protein n=1 Tax=Leucobacter sp. UCD-THU TaxID=1292023 RepID=UPI000379FBCD|nr:DUF4352 domain-containing protein [Leucobacter sp. UCD-THU]EYT55799.1 hypothetical protein H490_0103965 [Leucobacter sp. UCD-THU]
MKKLIIATAAALLLLTGCASQAEEKPAETSKQEQAEPAEQPAATEEAAPTAKIGEPVTSGDWEITINSWTADADAAVLEASGGVDVPEEGKQFALMNVTMKYNGTETGDTSLVGITYMPEGGNTASGLWEAFGTTPGENKLTYETLVPGGELTGDALYLIDADTTGEFWIVAPGATETAIVTP